MSVHYISPLHKKEKRCSVDLGSADQEFQLGNDILAEQNSLCTTGYDETGSRHTAGFGSNSGLSHAQRVDCSPVVGFQDLVALVRQLDNVLG